MSPQIVFMCVTAAFLIGYVVGRLATATEHWRDSVEQSRSYQSVIDDLEARLKAATVYTPATGTQARSVDVYLKGVD